MNSLLNREQGKIELFKKYGYDIVKARKYIVAKAKFGVGRMLEVGTGRGYMTIALAQEGFRLTSIDVDRGAQKQAKENLKINSFSKSAVFKIMNAERLRFPDNYFNSVISVNFIHHAQHPVRCVKEMVRVTKEKLVIADLNKRGERIMAKVHSLNGHRHHESRMSLVLVRALVKSLGMNVTMYHDRCQIVLVAKTGGTR
ncbi:MAG: class I SAM-dependent methyltransferase [Candidatus Omnitrophota bacterium]|nr:class I SAM-dependent methyltransferase [Candidatus Omnitrophota bacterium]